MSITEIGIEGEKRAMKFLKKRGLDIFQPDWLGCKDGKWVVYEVKHKDRFNPPPFEGHGLDICQIKARVKFAQDTGIQCFLLVFELDTNMVFGQWLRILEASEYHDTKNGIRIYPLTSFISL